MISILKNISSIFNKNNENDIVEIIEKGNLTLISIKEECTFKDYMDYVNKIKNNSSIVNLIPIRTFLTDNSDLLTCKLKKQLIWYEKNNNGFWVISRSRKDDELIISLSEYQEEHIDETVLELKDNKYKIIKYIHDYNFSTSFVKWYPEYNFDISCYFSLSKNEAMFYAEHLLNKFVAAKILDDNTVKGIYNILNLSATGECNIETNIEDKNSVNNFIDNNVLDENKNNSKVYRMKI